MAFFAARRTRYNKFARATSTRLPIEHRLRAKSVHDHKQRICCERLAYDVSNVQSIKSEKSLLLLAGLIVALSKWDIQI